MAHQARRGAAWRTVEAPVALAATLESECGPGTAVLVDQENCLNFQGLRCDVCYRVCPVIDEAITLPAASRNSTVKTAPPSGCEAARIVPPKLFTIP